MSVGLCVSSLFYNVVIGLDEHTFRSKLVNSFLPTHFNIYVLGPQKNRLIETHKICFG